MQDAAIGVFDSGVGGLTVVRALRALLPTETILYLGDTARVPYGTKSADTVQRYALEAMQFLDVVANEYQARQAQASSAPEATPGRRLKLLVVACNTVSAVALDVLRARANVPVIGVIRSAVWQALQVYQQRQIAVIGTEGTIHSGVYQRMFAQEVPGMEIIARPCNLLAPLVEEGWLDHPVTRMALDSYIGDLRDKSLGALILGCTHYPLLAPTIDAHFGGSIPLVEPSTCTAQEVSLLLQKRGWLAPSDAQAGELLCFVTDTPSRFRRIASRFLGEEVHHVEQVEMNRFVSAVRGSEAHDYRL